MSNVFDFSRFGKYFVYDLRNARAKYGINLLVFGLLPLAWYLIGVFPALFMKGAHIPSIDTRMGLFWVATIIFTLVFPAAVYGRLTDKAQGSEWILVPASRLEKFASMMLVCLVVMPVAYLALYSLTDWILSLCDPRYGQALAAFNINSHLPSGEEEYFQFTGRGFWFMWLNLIQIILVMLLGALCWRRGKVSLTILSVMAISSFLAVILGLVIGKFGLNFDFDKSMAERLAVNVMDNIELYINLGVWVHYGFWTILLGVCIWFVLRNLKH